MWSSIWQKGNVIFNTTKVRVIKKDLTRLCLTVVGNVNSFVFPVFLEMYKDQNVFNHQPWVMVHDVWTIW